MNIQIKEVGIKNLEEILAVQVDAFTGYGEDVIEILVRDLLSDKSATPLISLMAYENDKAVGHILFTKGYIDNPVNNLSVYCLAPLGVIRDYQNKGIGGELIKAGIKKLQELNADIVFVLGHTDYYPKFGFINNAIEKISYKATFDIPVENYDAWMYMPIGASLEEILKNPGRFICAEKLNKIDYWQE